jgi:hypothetical protein
MKVSFRESWRLRRIEARLRRSDPHLAGMLAIFARLSAGEAIASRGGRWALPLSGRPSWLPFT